jgi:hypothetical protein
MASGMLSNTMHPNKLTWFSSGVMSQKKNMSSVSAKDEQKIVYDNFS